MDTRIHSTDGESLEVAQKLESLVLPPVGISWLQVLNFHLDSPPFGCSSVSRWWLDSALLVATTSIAEGHTIAVGLQREAEVAVFARKTHDSWEIKELIENGVSALET